MYMYVIPYINKYEPWNFVDYKATDWLFPHALRKCLKSHLKCYFDIEDKGGMRFVEIDIFFTKGDLISYTCEM